MNKSVITQELRESESIILQQINNFQALFTGVCALNSLISQHPDTADLITIQTLEIILKQTLHLKQSNSFFLYRQTAETLVSVIKNSSDKKMIEKSLSVLKNTIIHSSKKQLRAVAEATGTLPLKINHTKAPVFANSEITSHSFNSILENQKIQHCKHHQWFGRSLVSDIDDEKILVFKMAKKDDCFSGLNLEGWFMEYLAMEFYSKQKFSIPLPLKFSGQFLFSIKNLPIPFKKEAKLHEENICIAFIANKDYFIYPNEKNQDSAIDEKSFTEIISRNSSLLGELSGSGFVHTAPVPLFHNRVQQNRREDGGLYEWDKGGRLDSWLKSCRYPNFGQSGVRDFEHIEIFKGNSRKLYKNIGSHILSLILVSGSFFRNIGKDNANYKLIGNTGFDENQNPLDARNLFDKNRLELVLETIITNYYQSFTGTTKSSGFSFEPSLFSQKIIDEMGVDKHMEEVLRVADQKKMDENDFKHFLLERGFEPNKISYYKKGEKDISIKTGPHLGGFNQKFSIPEITDLLAKVSALCIAGKFDAERDIAKQGRN